MCALYLVRLIDLQLFAPLIFNNKCGLYISWFSFFQDLFTPQHFCPNTFLSSLCQTTSMNVPSLGCKIKLLAQVKRQIKLWIYKIWTLSFLNIKQQYKIFLFIVWENCTWNVRICTGQIPLKHSQGISKV